MPVREAVEAHSFHGLFTCFIFLSFHFALGGTNPTEAPSKPCLTQACVNTTYQAQREKDESKSEADRESLRAAALGRTKEVDEFDKKTSPVLVWPKPATNPSRMASQPPKETNTPTQTNSQCNSYAQRAQSTCSSSLSSVNSINQSVSQVASNMSDKPAVACAQLEQAVNNGYSQMNDPIASCQSVVSSCQSSCKEGDSGNDTCNQANVTLQGLNVTQSNLNQYNTAARQCRSDSTTGESNSQAKQSAMDGSAFSNLNSGSGSSGSYQSPTATGGAAGYQPQNMAQPQTTVGSSSPAASTDSSLGNTMSENVDSMIKSPYQKSEMTRVAEQSGGAGNQVGGSGAAPITGIQLLQSDRPAVTVAEALPALRQTRALSRWI